MNRKINNEAGFTLVEMLVVVVILSVLAGIILPRFTGRTKDAKKAAAKIDITEGLSKALELYEIDNDSFPASEFGLILLLENKNNLPSWKGPYIKNNSINDPWGTSYYYLSPGVHDKQDYDLWSAGPDGVSGNEDDIVSWQ